MKDILAIISFAFACILITVNMLMPPVGEIAESAIYCFAQLLLFSATLLGVDAVITNRIRDGTNPQKK